MAELDEQKSQEEMHWDVRAEKWSKEKAMLGFGSEDEFVLDPGGPRKQARKVVM